MNGISKHLQRASGRAFTLIEISIVLVVISLIIGGVLVGNNMVNAARLARVISEKEQYVTAIKKFQETYNALPGDMFNATSFWPAQTNCVAFPANSSPVSPAGEDGNTCNGNGDGKLATPGNDRYESHRAWQHLALAGLIDGVYEGGYLNSGTPTATAGAYVPKSSYPGEPGWHVYHIGNPTAASADFFAGKYGHILYMGNAAYSVAAASKAVVLAPDVQHIDAKIDDGKPATGTVRVGKNTGTLFGGSTGCASSDAVTATYSTSSAVLCVPIFITGIP